MIILRTPLFPIKMKEMATSCHPRYKGGRYPMWIRVEYTNGEHMPPHAHLYKPEGRPTRNSLITKFLISDTAPTTPNQIQVMKGKPPLPLNYARMIVNWAKESDEYGLNNWVGLRRDWLGLENTFKAGLPC